MKYAFLSTFLFPVVVIAQVAFGSPQLITDSQSTEDIELADLDGDLDEDLIVISYNKANFVVC